jgi:branched-chain amino acid transport system permease protein
MSAGFIDLVILVGIFSIVTLGLDFIVGYTKIFSVNQALMFAVGTFSYVFTYQMLGSVSIVLSSVIAVAFSLALSALVGVASLPVRGDSLVIVCFGAQIIGMQVIYNLTPISGGASGMFDLPTPTVFGWTPGTQTQYLLLVWIVTAAVYGATALIVRSPWGRLLRAVGEDEVAVAAGGFNPRRLKVVAFMMGGSYAAIAGCLYVGYLGTAQVGDYSLSTSISLLAMVILGGAGRLLGGLAGAVVYALVPFLLDYADLPSASAAFIKQGIFGLALLAVVLFAPAGLSGGISSLLQKASGARRGGDRDRGGGGPGSQESAAQ